jgi:ketosteroid isomerase-like protein
MTENHNTKLIQTMYAAFGAGDIQTILDLLSPDVEWTLTGPAGIPYSGKKVGPSQVLTFFQSLATTQEHHKLTIDVYIAQGDHVATTGRYSALVKATGKLIDGPVAHVFTIKNGKVVKFLDFVDTAQMADAYTHSSTGSQQAASGE